MIMCTTRWVGGKGRRLVALNHLSYAGFCAKLQARFQTFTHTRKHAHTSGNGPAETCVCCCCFCGRICKRLYSIAWCASVRRNTRGGVTTTTTTDLLWFLFDIIWCAEWSGCKISTAAAGAEKPSTARTIVCRCKTHAATLFMVSQHCCANGHAMGVRC